MKNVFLIFFTIFFFHLFSCEVVEIDTLSCQTISKPKKDTTRKVEPKPERFYRMATLTNDDGYQEVYDYNTKGELVKTVNSQGISTHYEYNKDFVTISEINSSKKLISKKKCWLNESGFQDTEEYYQDDKMIYYNVFEYDNNGYLIKESKYENNVGLVRTKKWTVENHQIVTYEEKETDGVNLSLETKFDTLTSKPLTDQINGIAFKGNATKSAIKTEISGGKLFVYTYETNDEGYVNKRSYFSTSLFLQTKSGYTLFTYKWIN